MAQLLSYQKEQVLLVPRTAVQREGDVTYVTVDQQGRRERRNLTLGWADLRHYEVLSGLQPGEQVVVP